METKLSPEQDLLEQARKLNHQALAQIYDLYSPGLYRYSMRILGDSTQAEDCVAETFSRFLQALSRHKGPREHLQAYLYQVAHNWIMDQYRRGQAPGQLKEDVPDFQPDIETSVDVKLRNDNLRSALLRLSDNQQQVIALKYLEGYDNEEIAQLMHKPVGAIKSLQHRALASLQRILQEKLK